MVAGASRAGRWRATPASLLIVCAIVSLACSRADRPRKVQLAHLPARVGPIAIADDGNSYAYVEITGDSQSLLVHDGVKSEAFPFIGGVTFAPGTHRVFYWAGGVTGHLVADGTMIGRGDFVHEGPIVFSADGGRWATTCTANTTPKSAVVLVDGEEIGRYADASIPTISPDARHVAFLAADDGSTTLVIDGARQTTFAAPTDECAARAVPKEGEPKGRSFWPQFQVKYLSDGSLVSMTQDADGWGVYRDGRRIATYAASLVQQHPKLSDECADVTAVAAWTLTVAEKAPVVVWWERLRGTDNRWRVVVNGKPADDVLCSRPYLAQPPELTPDGSHVAYACAADDPEKPFTVVADRTRYGPYVDVLAYAWADDGSRVAYGAVDKPQPQPLRYYVDGEPLTDYFSAVWRPRFDPSTGRLAWEAEVSRAGQRVLGLGRRPISSFEQVFWGPTFTRTGVVSWVIQRGRRLVRLDVPTR